MRIRLTEFRIRNFRCIDDSGWIRAGDITALVGVNEAGKTALLNGLHTLNPGSGEIEFEKIKDIFGHERLVAVKERHFVTLEELESTNWFKDWMVEREKEYQKRKIEIKEIGSRLGEKIHEELMTKYEADSAYQNDEMIVITEDYKYYTNKGFLPMRHDSYASDTAHIMNKEEIDKLLHDIYA